MPRPRYLFSRKTTIIYATYHKRRCFNCLHCLPIIATRNDQSALNRVVNNDVYIIGRRLKRSDLAAKVTGAADFIALRRLLRASQMTHTHTHTQTLSFAAGLLIASPNSATSSYTRRPSAMPTILETTQLARTAWSKMWQCDHDNEKL